MFTRQQFHVLKTCNLLSYWNFSVDVNICFHLQWFQLLFVYDLAAIFPKLSLGEQELGSFLSGALQKHKNPHLLSVVWENSLCR